MANFFGISLKAVISLLSAFALFGCGGGGSGSDSNTATVTPAVVKDLVKSTQRSQWPKVYNFSGVVYPKDSLGRIVIDQKLFRWNIEKDGLIPVLYTTSYPDLYNAGLDKIETAIGRKIFDRTSLNGVSTATITANNTRALILGDRIDSTSGSESCGQATNIWISDDYSILKANPGKTISNYLGVNVNFANTASCPNTALLVVHELAHALGAITHFDGFGTGDEASGIVLEVLKKIYANPVGSSYDTLN